MPKATGMTRSGRIVGTLQMSNGSWIAGADLATRFGCDESAVWRALEDQVLMRYVEVRVEWQGRRLHRFYRNRRGGRGSSSSSTPKESHVT